jgi:hypothetical protein
VGAWSAACAEIERPSTAVPIASPRSGRSPAIARQNAKYSSVVTSPVTAGSGTPARCRYSTTPQLIESVSRAMPAP